MIGARLKEERDRLGYTQPVLAEYAGVSKRTVVDWEKGVSSPTAVQLAKLSEAGVDVLYVLTGLRTVFAQEALNSQERVLLDNYRHMHPTQKKFIEDAAFMASESSLNKAAA